MKKLRIPCPPYWANVFLAISFIAAVFNGLCSYILLDTYYNPPFVHYRNGIEELFRKVDDLDNWLIGMLFAAFAAMFLFYINAYLLWYICYRITREK